MLTAQLASWDARRAWGELRSALPDTPDDRAAPVVERLIGARRRALEAEAADGLARRGLAVTGAVGVQRFVGEDGRATAGPALGLGIALPFSLSGGYAREREVVRLRREADQAGLAADSSAYAVARAQARQAGESARARVRLYDDALLAGAADEREGAVAGFRTGTVSLLELIDFERSLAEAERGRWLAIQDVLAADAALVTSATRSFPPVVRDLAEGAAP
jgi:outer membrane protein TolC